MMETAKLWHLNPDCLPVGFQCLPSYAVQKQPLAASAASVKKGSIQPTPKQPDQTQAEGADLSPVRPTFHAQHLPSTANCATYWNIEPN